MIVTLDSFRPLKNAVRFYKKYGFKETGVTTDLYGIEIFEMIKELDQIKRSNFLF
jgi:hypothetical protein